MIRFVSATLGLTAIYALALASADPWDLLTGFVLAVLVLAVFRRHIFPTEAISGVLALKRAAHFPALVGAVVLDIIDGTVAVARVVLSSGPPQDAGFVEIPQGDRTHLGTVISGLLDTLSPGSVLIEVDSEDRTWTVHELNASDKAEVIEAAQRMYEKYQKPVWP
jgi:multisubunit Na+/H+ antiporter MnhE subunit